MSQEGYDKLVAELRHMESVELPQVGMPSQRPAIRVTSARTSNTMLPSVNKLVCWDAYDSSRRCLPMRESSICRDWVLTAYSCSARWK